MRTLLVAAILVAFGSTHDSHAATTAFGNGIPKLFFSYSYLLDSDCPAQGEFKIDPKWQAEAEARTPEFQAIWDKESQILLGEVLKYFGKGYSRTELTATLTVCNNGSMSNPLIVNVRPLLASFMAPQPVRPIQSFTDTVFHEMLHNWLVENAPDHTPLMDKYAATEPELVMNHIQVFAIEKLVYTRLGRTEDLKWLDFVNHWIGDEYLRAWQIVNDIEGYEGFVAELKN